MDCFKPFQFETVLHVNRLASGAVREEMRIYYTLAMYAAIAIKNATAIVGTYLFQIPTLLQMPGMGFYDTS